jgi:hypothetical protein
MAQKQYNALTSTSSFPSPPFRESDPPPPWILSLPWPPSIESSSSPPCGFVENMSERVLHVSVLPPGRFGVAKYANFASHPDHRFRRLLRCHLCPPRRELCLCPGPRSCCRRRRHPGGRARGVGGGDDKCLLLISVGRRVVGWVACVCGGGGNIQLQSFVPDGPGLGATPRASRTLRSSSPSSPWMSVGFVGRRLVGCRLVGWLVFDGVYHTPQNRAGWEEEGAVQ